MSKFVMADGREYEISIRQITNREAELLETVTGKRYPQLSVDLVQGGPTGKTAFLWLAMRKSGRHEPYEDLEFPMGDTVFHLEEVDPTQASPATPTDASTSPESTGSPNGPPSPPR
ncbi:MAG TPA: hypothetical protein VGX25_04010 [Actinophytocola sp.]|uniref:hypothetical protein n=1 Tax=Actinophytocola sp. TaxID=1872138 RepID=UPI002DDD72ED|nr:hypothetical protein [Actinophytocola sp.]HEV2778543.1 hypothetical protein [Actinophytocola sp.]